MRIAIDRPEKRNAINGEVHESLADVFADVNNTSTRVVVLTGNGKAFSAGGDLEWLQERDIPHSFYTSESIVKNMLMLDRPIIAKVHGDAIGLGATIALFSDLIVAQEDAKIGDPHVNAGVVAGDGGAVIWPNLVSMCRAKEFLLTGKIVDASKAEDIGLINYALPDEEFEEKVNELVQELTSGPQIAIRYTKLALNKHLETDVNAILRESLALERLSMYHDDHEEAVEAFLEGREPDFPSAQPENDLNR